MHCMTVSLAEGGMGLGAMWGEQKAREMLSGAGFTSIEAAHVDGDRVNMYLIAAKSQVDLKGPLTDCQAAVGTVRDS
jgi:hypothetical protein